MSFHRFCLLAMLGILHTSLACLIIIDPPHPIPPRPVPPHPLPRPIPQLQPMQVRSHRASLELTDRFAQVTVNATFYNPNNQRIEGTYIFPIAADAALSSFAMTVNGKTLEAELLPADKARSIYESIVRSMRDPGLLEYIDQGLLKARVFPIEPNSEVKIQLTYEQTLVRDGAVTRFAYPLLSARPEGAQSIASVVIDATLSTKAPIKTLYAPGFDAQVSRQGNTGARLTWEATNHTPDKDFQILFSADGDKIGVDFLGYRKGDQGYFLIFISPNSELQAEEIAAKDITFVVDTSGSMTGDKLRQTQQALRYCINNLTHKDHFNIIAFATDVNPLFEESRPADEANLKAAREFIDGMRARGGTAISDALAKTLATAGRGEAVPLVVFLTDGLPTIGDVDPQQILKQLDNSQRRQRIFTFGVGDDVNTRLLDGIASRSRGYTTYVRPGEDLELALTGFYEKVASPVMTDLQLDTGDVRLSESIPSQLPDLFRGSQLILAGQYTGTGTKAFTLSGNVQGARERFRFEADLNGSPHHAFIPRLWAIRRVGQLQEAIRLNGEKQELVDEVKRLGREYGIATSYTSFLIVEEGLAVHERRAAREELDRMRPQSAVQMESGAGAVRDAQASQQMKQGRDNTSDFYAAAPATQGAAPAIVTPERLDTLIAHAGDKTFYFRHADSTWYDSLIPPNDSPTPQLSVTAWSEDFFELLRKHPALKSYLKAGIPLVVRIDGMTIRVTSPND